MLVMEALLRLVRASDAPIMPDVLLRVISDESSPASAKVDAYGRRHAHPLSYSRAAVYLPRGRATP